jgi:hypothetical protein
VLLAATAYAAIQGLPYFAVLALRSCSPAA